MCLPLIDLEAPGPCLKQMMQILILKFANFVKTNFFIYTDPSLIVKRQRNRIELVTRPCASDTPAVSPSFPLTPLRRCVRVLFVATLARLHYVFRHCFRSPHNSRCGTAFLTTAAGLLPVILVLGESSALPETQ